MIPGVSSLLVLAVFPAALIVAALKDATTFTIPNWISGLLLVAFFPAAWLAGLPLETFWLNLGIGGAALLVGMGLFALNWCGGGDAKLLAMAALWLGWPAVLPFLLATGVAGGLLAIGLIVGRKGLLGVVAMRGPAWLGRLMSPEADLPYGLAIAVGGLAAFPSSAIVAAAAGG